MLWNFNFKFELIQESEHFAMIDSVDNIISLAWEKYDENNDNARLFFKFGEPLESVVSKLNKRGYNLLKEEIKINEE